MELKLDRIIIYISVSFSMYYIYIYNIQGVPGVKVTTSGVTSLGDAESKTSYTHGPIRNGSGVKRFGRN